MAAFRVVSFLFLNGNLGSTSQLSSQLAFYFSQIDFFIHLWEQHLQGSRASSPGWCDRPQLLLLQLFLGSHLNHFLLSLLSILDPLSPWLAHLVCVANLAGVTQAHISKGLSPWYIAFLSLGLLRLSIHCQNRTREYQETPKCIFYMPDTFLHVPIVISSIFF